jgi:hypothetical protein
VSCVVWIKGGIGEKVAGISSRVNANHSSMMVARTTQCVVDLEEIIHEESGKGLVG